MADNLLINIIRIHTNLQLSFKKNLSEFIIIIIKNLVLLIGMKL